MSAAVSAFGGAAPPGCATGGAGEAAMSASSCATLPSTSALFDAFGCSSR